MTLPHDQKQSVDKYKKTKGVVWHKAQTKQRNNGVDTKTRYGHDITCKQEQIHLEHDVKERKLSVFWVGEISEKTSGAGNAFVEAPWRIRSTRLRLELIRGQEFGEL